MLRRRPRLELVEVGLRPRARCVGVYGRRNRAPAACESVVCGPPARRRLILFNPAAFAVPDTLYWIATIRISFSISPSTRKPSLEVAPNTSTTFTSAFSADRLSPRSASSVVAEPLFLHVTELLPITLTFEVDLDSVKVNQRAIYVGQRSFIMVALWNRADHYIFILFLLLSFFLSFFSSPNLSGRRLDVYHTLAHGVALVRI